MFRCLALLAAAMHVSVLAQPLLPAPDGDRFNQNAVPWQIDESGIDAVTFDQRRDSDPRIADFEFVPEVIASSNGFPLSSFDVNSYFTVEIANNGQYATTDIVRVGPAAPSVVVQALRDQDLRPIDIEVRPFVDLGGAGTSVISQRMMATAVPNPPRAGGPIVWDILLDRTQNEVDSLILQQSPALRPIDIEYSGQVQRGPIAFRGYAVLAVENEPGRPMGEIDWDIKWNASDFALGVFQSEPIGRLVDFEIYPFLSPINGAPRYDAILYDWQGETPYNQLANLPGDLGSLFDADTSNTISTFFQDNERLVPLFTAGYRPIDIEYTWDDGTFNRVANAAVIDAPTGLQRRVRDALDDEAVNFARNTNQISGLDIKEIGGERFDGIHPQLGTAGTQDRFSGSFDRVSPPAFAPFLAVYAYLFDDIALTEQQLNTCFPAQCPVPDGVCDPELFTVAQLVDRTLDLGDYSAANTLIVERYGYANFVNWIDTLLGPFPDPFDPERFFVADGLCLSQFSLKQLSGFTEQLADGTIAQGQLQDDILAALFDDSPNLRSAIKVIVDDEAVETDLTTEQVDQFKQALGVRQRVLTRFDPFSSTHRTMSMHLLSVPLCDGNGSITSRDFAVSAFIETAALDLTATDAAVAAALTDAIADALGNWDACEAEPCPADTNGDGFVTPADFNAWILAFNGQLPACDQNGDGLCTPADFNAWILNYNSGC